MKSLFFLILVLNLSFLISCYDEVEDEAYDSTDFVNKNLEDFQKNPTNDYSLFYQPLLTLIQKTIPYLQRTARKLTGNVEYIRLYFQDNFGIENKTNLNQIGLRIWFVKDYEYIQDRLDDAILWIQKRMFALKGKEDEGKLKEIQKDLEDGSDLFDSLVNGLLKKFRELEYYNILEKQEEQNPKTEQKDGQKQIQENDDEIIFEFMELNPKQLKEEVKKDIIKIASKQEYIKKIEAAVEKLKLLVKSN